jgi:hypothetical protein
MGNDLRSKLEKHPELKGLLKNPAWKPITHAVINFHVDQKECPNDYWKESKIWAEAEAIVLKIKNAQ